MRTAVATSLGIVRGRDAIFLDHLCHLIDKDQLIFEGDFNARLCSDYRGEERFVAYRLVFYSPRHYQCWEFDLAPDGGKAGSSFDRVNDSPHLRQLGLSDFQHYELATYDFVYSIVCKRMELQLAPTE